MTIFIGATKTEAPAKKRAPRSRKPKTEKPAAPIEEPKAEEAEPAAEPDGEGVTLEDIKPKRTRTRRKTSEPTE